MRRPYFWLALHRTKVRWRFCKILWPSQNILTLKINKSETIYHFRTNISKFLPGCTLKYIQLWWWDKKRNKLLSDLFTFKYTLATNRTKSWEQWKPQNVQFWVAPLRFSTIAWARHRYCVHSIKSAIARCTVYCFFQT